MVELLLLVGAKAWEGVGLQVSSNFNRFSLVSSHYFFPSTASEAERSVVFSFPLVLFWALMSPLSVWVLYNQSYSEVGVETFRRRNFASWQRVFGFWCSGNASFRRPRQGDGWSMNDEPPSASSVP